MNCAFCFFVKKKLVVTVNNKLDDQEFSFFSVKLHFVRSGAVESCVYNEGKKVNCSRSAVGHSLQDFELNRY